MAQDLYCWRCDVIVPMLDEAEWERMDVALSQVVPEIQRYRAEHDVSLAEALEQSFGHQALDLYERMTGMRETNVNAIRHHRLSMYGPPCVRCGKPLRTPQAKLCAACGAMRARDVGATVFGASRMQVLSALSDALGPLAQLPDAGQTHGRYRAGEATIAIRAEAEGYDVEVYDSAQWPTSLALARYLACHTGGRVHCDTGEDGCGADEHAQKA